jgi:hypothetical protein
MDYKTLIDLVFRFFLLKVIYFREKCKYIKKSKKTFYRKIYFRLFVIYSKEIL